MGYKFWILIILIMAAIIILILVKKQIMMYKIAVKVIIGILIAGGLAIGYIYLTKRSGGN